MRYTPKQRSNSGIIALTIELIRTNLRAKGESVEVKRATLVTAFLILSPAAPADTLPLNPAVRQETIDQTICVIGWTKTVRPPAAYANRSKLKLIRELGLPEELLADFELDHRIPLALGGAPSDPRNLELQPWDEASVKDAIEACLARAVCSGKITLDEARSRIWRDWRHVGVDCGRG